MAKTIIKELIITLLLCLFIILILGILLYDYAPMSKTIPNPVSYITPDEIIEELNSSTSIDENQLVLTYEIDSTDLNNYKRIQDYKPGKTNPFSSWEVNAESPQDNQASGNGTNNTGVSQNSESNNTNTNSNENTSTNLHPSNGGK